MSEYLKYEFAQNQAVSSLKKIKLKNVKDAATAISKVNTNRGGMNAKLYALRGYDNKVYRFIMIAPNNIFNNIQKDFSYIVSNFRTLTKSQASRIKPFYVRYRNIRRGDSFASLAKIMSIKKDSQGLLRAINGFDVGDKLPKSGRIKLILNR